MWARSRGWQWAAAGLSPPAWDRHRQGGQGPRLHAPGPLLHAGPALGLAVTPARPRGHFQVQPQPLRASRSGRPVWARSSASAPGTWGLCVWAAGWTCPHAWHWAEPGLDAPWARTRWDGPSDATPRSLWPLDRPEAPGGGRGSDRGRTLGPAGSPPAPSAGRRGRECLSSEALTKNILSAVKSIKFMRKLLFQEIAADENEETRGARKGGETSRQRASRLHLPGEAKPPGGRPAAGAHTCVSGP